MRHAALIFVLAVAVTAIAPGRAEAEKIREIVISGNAKTTDETVRYLAGIDEGDSWNLETQEEVRIELVDSGLFKNVDVFSQPHPKGGVQVTIVAKDKHSWAIAPTYYNQPTNKGGGLGFGENNLFGENKKLLLYGQIATGDSFLVAGYIDPSIAGTPFQWQYDLYLSRKRMQEYVHQQDFLPEEGGPSLAERGQPIIARESKLDYMNTGVKVGVELFRSLALRGRIRAAKVGYTQPKLGEGAVESQVDPSLVDGCVADGNCTLPKPGMEGWDTSVEGILQFDRIANWYGMVSGDRFRVSYERSVAALSDFDYWYGNFRWIHARRYFERANFMMRSGVSYGKDIPFQHEFTSGGTRLRGYKNRQFRGDFRGFLSAEYSIQLLNIKGFALRGHVFGDGAYTAFIAEGDNEVAGVRHYLPGHDVLEASKLAPLRTSVGLGTRVYIRQIVLPLLGLDVGYGLESGGVEIYFAIGLTDL